METIRARVDEVGEKHFLVIGSRDEEVRIPMSDDDPNAVKSAFNSLITRVRGGEFKIEFHGTGDDLFSQVGAEYVTQLNREIGEVRGEMVHLGLVDGQQ